MTIIITITITVNYDMLRRSHVPRIPSLLHGPYLHLLRDFHKKISQGSIPTGHDRDEGQRNDTERRNSAPSMQFGSCSQQQSSRTTPDKFFFYVW
jgi:hypothetical protein